MNRWWRAYDEAVDDPKLCLLSDAAHRAWFNLMCVASIYGGTLPSLDVIAVKLRLKPAKVTAFITELLAAGLIDETETGLQPHNWNGRQYKSDVSTERVKRFRERERNVSETPPENREQNTERKKESFVRSPAATRPKTSEAFEEFWKAYPRRLGANPKKPAFAVFEAALRQGADPPAIIEGARRCAVADADKIGTPYIPQAVKWLRDQRWNDYAAAPVENALTDAKREQMFAELRSKKNGFEASPQGGNLPGFGAGARENEGLGRQEPAATADDRDENAGMARLGEILQ